MAIFEKIIIATALCAPLLATYWYHDQLLSGMYYACNVIFTPTITLFGAMFNGIIAVTSNTFNAAFNIFLAILSPFIFIFNMIFDILGTGFNFIVEVPRGLIMSTGFFLLRLTEGLLKFLWHYWHTITLLMFTAWQWQQNSQLRLRQDAEKKDITYSTSAPTSLTSGNLDAIVDFVLREASRHIIGSQPLPDVEETIQVPFPLGIRRECQFKAFDGVIKPLNMLCRDGPASIQEKPGGLLVLEAAVGYRTLVVQYSAYAAHVEMGLIPPIYASGDLRVAVSPLTVRVVIRLRSPFRAELCSLSVQRIGPIELDVTGLGEWIIMWPTIKEAILPRLKEVLVQAVFQAKPKIEEALRDLSRRVESIPQFRVFETPRPQSGSSFRAANRTFAPAPSTTLTPSGIAIAGGLALGTVALIGLVIDACTNSEEPQEAIYASGSDEED